MSTIEEYKVQKHHGEVMPYSRWSSMKKTKRKAEETAAYDYNSVLSHAFIPPREVADALVGAYLDTFEYTHRILHVPTFEKQYAQFWTAVTDQGSTFIAKLLMVCAVGSFNEAAIAKCPDTHELLREQVPAWLSAVRQWLDKATQEAEEGLGTLQVHCLLIIARQLHADDRDHLWISTGSLVRSAMTMGLHRDPSAFTRMIPFTAEMRRRLWCTIIELDLQASHDAGKPMSIPDGVSDCNPPSNLDDEQVGVTPPTAKPNECFTRTSFQIALLKSLPARKEVIRLANGLQAKSCRGILTLGADITRALGDLPPCLTFSEKGAIGSSRPTEFAAAFLDLLIRRFLASVHRHGATLGAYDPAYHFSRVTCVDSSLVILATLGLLNKPSAVVSHTLRSSCGGMFDLDLLHAAITICLELIMEKIDVDTLGCSIRSRVFSGHSNNFDRESLIDAVEGVVKALEPKIVRHQGDTHKSYVLLRAALSSAKARHDGVNPQAAVSAEMVNSIARCKDLLLQQGRPTQAGLQVPDSEVSLFRKPH